MATIVHAFVALKLGMRSLARRLALCGARIEHVVGGSTRRLRQEELELVQQVRCVLEQLLYAVVHVFDRPLGLILVQDVQELAVDMRLVLKPVLYGTATQSATILARERLPRLHIRSRPHPVPLAVDST